MKKNQGWFSVFLLVLTFFSFQTKGEEGNGSEIFRDVVSKYSVGQYTSALNEIEALEVNLKKSNNLATYKGTIAFWKGQIHFKLQNFNEAKSSFKEAIEEKFKSKELYYLYGQVLYALNDLIEARKAFGSSFGQGYKKAVSLYYMAFISQTLEDYKQAVKFYQMIEKSDDPEKNEIQQAALVQIGDIFLSQSEKEKESSVLVRDFVIPQYKKAINVVPNSDFSEELYQRVNDLEKKYNLVIYKMRNGKGVSSKRYIAKISQTGRYDTNIIYQADDSTNKAAKAGSPVSVTDFLGRYTYYWKDIASIAPEFRTNLIYNGDRSTAQIFSNDTFLVQGGVRTSWEHSLGGKVSSFLFDYTLAKNYRDYNSKHEFNYFNTTETVLLGERIEFFSQGESYIRFLRKKLDSYNPNYDSVTTTLRFEQMAKLYGNTIYLASGLNNYESKTDSQKNRSLDFNAFYYLPPFGKWGALTLGLNATVTDPYNNRGARGVEFLINPSVKLAKNITKNFIFSADYSYFKNKSKDTTSYAYSKHQINLNLDYYF